MEKRLIDANAADVDRIYCFYGSHCTLEDVQQWLDERPTVDAVEVIRCRDCKRFVDNKKARVTYCRRDLKDMTVNPNDFCSYGERRTDE